MKPDIWGPTAWNYIHFLSFSYPDNPTQKDITNYKLFLEYFGKTLPCQKCQNNFKKHIKNFDIDNGLTSKADFINLIWKLHNKVNKDLGKKELSFNNFIKLYENILELDAFNGINYLETSLLYRKIILGLLFLIIVISFILYHKLKK